jgi:urease accessory protein
LNFSTDRNSWLVWQLADSAFPTGGFAHSGGLEAAWQHGEIPDSVALESYLESALWQIASGVIPYLAAGYDTPENAGELDEHCDAFLSNHVANRASRAQGRAFLGSAHRIFGSAARVEAQFTCYHFAPVFGVMMRALSVDRSIAVELFAFQSLRGLVAAAIRLGIVGPMEGQAMQSRLSPKVREMLSSTDGLTINEVATVAPLLEIWQGSQDRLYSRLFQT